MIQGTTYEPEAIKVLNNIPVFALKQGCIDGFVRLDINNGQITGAIQKHRDYVWKTDGRQNYI